MGGVFKWWTLSQRIRTFAQIPFEAEIVDTGTAPIYQQIALKAFHLKQLGMNDSAIARSLGVTDKTVAKAVDWFRLIKHQFNDKNGAI
jgi:hypothetical protein